MGSARNIRRVFARGIISDRHHASEGASTSSKIDYSTFLRDADKSAYPEELSAVLNQFIERKGAFTQKNGVEEMRQRQAKSREAKARREANMNELNVLERRILVAAQTTKALVASSQYD